ncbi:MULTISPECIES: TetR/AcrR family transcriptional regulator [Cyanophyceae]|uniref:TetR/AcrR family transcriptional regulator n=1 Tax=Cyanophyceae TaxID=3028117 RepID=UPI001687305E|nr:TetR/AcrR family transcriptional regulator [Trichocoleus sp. FACHB-69]MBD1930361.1 TetR/AcrR family transcriptional regulator [Trichocoleus sp. FACHB-69]
MVKKSNQSSSREVVLDTAEQLFMARGYTAVTLKHIADHLGMKQASLYYHFPQGKEELYVEVILRHLERRRVRLKQLLAEAPPELEGRLQQIGTWLIQQPPLNGSRMILTDLPELSPESSARLEVAMYHCIFAPLEALFVEHRDQLHPALQSDPGLIGGTFLSAIEALYTVKRYGSKTDEALVADLITLLLEGALKP